MLAATACACALASIGRATGFRKELLLGLAQLDQRMMLAESRSKCSFSGTWRDSFGGDITHVEQVGTSLTIVDRHQSWSPAKGHVDGHGVVAKAFGIEGRLSADCRRLVWSNSAIWHRAAAGATSSPAAPPLVAHAGTLSPTAFPTNAGTVPKPSTSASAAETVSIGGLNVKTKTSQPASSMGFADTPGEIVVGVVSSAATEHRAVASAKTWARQFRHVVFFSEAPLPRVAIAGFDVRVVKPLDAQDRVTHSAADASWKTFSALLQLQQIYPDAQNYMLIQDGAFVVGENFMCDLRTSFKPSDLVYAGFRCSTSVPEPSGWRPIHFISLASGIVLNRKVVTLLEPHLHECSAWGLGITGDVRLARCIDHVSEMYGLHIGASTLDGVIDTDVNQQLTSARAIGAYGAGLSALHDLAVVFHNVSDVEMTSLYQISKLAHAQGAPLSFAMISDLFPATQPNPESAQIAHYPWENGCLNTASGSCKCCKGVHTKPVPVPSTTAVPPVVSPYTAPPRSAAIATLVQKKRHGGSGSKSVVTKEQPKDRRDLSYLMNLFVDAKEKLLHPF